MRDDDDRIDDDDWYEEDGPECDPRCEDGVIVVCPDDMCRGSGGCGRYGNASCYRYCPGCF